MNFRTRLTVMVCCWALLATGIPPASAQKRDWNLPQCPPNCGGGGGGRNYKAAVATSVSNTNQEVNNQQLTKAQYLNWATMLQKALTEGQNNGTLAALDNYIITNASIFEAPNVDYGKLYPGLVAVGYQGTQQQVVQWAQKTTQADRIAFVNAIKYNGGMAAQYAAVIQLLQAMGAPGHRPAMNCHAIAVTAATATAGAAFLFLIPGAQGGAALWGLVGGGFGLAYVILRC